MPARKKAAAAKKDSTAHLGFEAKLWLAADKLRNNMDAAEYSRVNRELTDEDLAKIAGTYHAWRGDLIGSGGLQPPSSDPGSSKLPLHSYEDIPGFCKSATIGEIEKHGFVLTPGRYVGAEEAEDDGEPFEEKMPRLVAELNAQFAESAKLEQAIKANLRVLGYGG